MSDMTASMQEILHSRQADVPLFLQLPENQARRHDAYMPKRKKEKEWPPAREVAGDNLVKLLHFNKITGKTPDSDKALSEASGVSRPQIAAIRKKTNVESGTGLNHLEAIARQFGLQAWQMLVPGLNPASHPALAKDVESEAAQPSAGTAARGAKRATRGKDGVGLD